MVILDTNIIIDHLRRRGQESHLLKLSYKIKQDQLGISVISIQELFEGASTRNESERDKLLATVAPLKTFPYTFEIAKLAGEIARDSKQTIEFADAAIAATAITHDTQLATLNRKDFQGIKELKLI